MTARMNKMYESDQHNTYRRSHENPEVRELYKGYLEDPREHAGGEYRDRITKRDHPMSHHLHTTYTDRSVEVK